MKFPVFATVIVFIIWLAYEIHKSNKKNEKAGQDFWSKEFAANSVRKKSLDNLNYILIPFDKLPFSLLAENSIVQECIQQIKSLQDKKIVNLNGISNTDLKLAYGTANITVLSEYDQNYILFARYIAKWGEELYEAGFLSEAAFVLELGINSGTDVSSNYKILARIYLAQGEPSRIAELKAAAEKLNSIMKPAIIRSLNEFSHAGR